MLPRLISGVNINNPELNRSHRRGGDHPKRWRQHIERCLGFAAPSGAQSGQLCINYPPPLLPASSHIHTPVFLPAKSALLPRGSRQPGPLGSPLLRLTFPSFVAQHNTTTEEAKR